MTTITFTGDDARTQALSVIAQSAPEAYRLVELEALLDRDWHDLWLDETTATVWHAHAELTATGAPTGRWSLDDEPAQEALAWLEDYRHLPEDALADPDGPGGAGFSRQEAMAVLDEFATVGLQALRVAAGERIAALRGETAGERAAAQLTVAQVVDREIQRRITLARAEMARWAGLRAHHIRELIGTERGGQARLARELGLSEPTIHGLLRADDERRALAALDRETQ